MLVQRSLRGTDTNEEVVQAHRLKHGPRVLWQPHEPHLAIFGVGEALRGQKERKSFKINDMRVCEVDQDIRLGVFWNVYGDIGHGFNGGRNRREASAPSVAVVPAHDHLLVRVEGAGDAMPVRSDLASRVVPKRRIPSLWPQNRSATSRHGETSVSVED